MNSTTNPKLTTTEILKQIEANIDSFTDAQLNTINDLVTIQMFGQDDLLLDDDFEDSEDEDNFPLSN